MTESVSKPESAVADSPSLPRVNYSLRVINLLAVILPPTGLVVAIVLLWGVAFSHVYLWLLLGFYLASGLGITIGYHRLFTHRSFWAPAPVRFALGVMGSMAIEGPLFKWVAQHRKHHQHSDHEQDPHSPHLSGSGWLGVLRGFWHSHVGWLFTADSTDLSRYVGDLRRDKTARIVSRLFILWAALGLILPAILGGLLTWSWMGLLLGFLWCGLVRVLLVHHVTWSINSICHLWGQRPFKTSDNSRNNALFGILGMGEGWHNNHHAFPTSARHGLRWWQLDGSYLLIRLMALLHLARDIRIPNREAIQAHR